MKACTSSALAACALALSPGASMAQVPDELRARLGREGVARNEAWVFASASGVVRGTPEAEEDRQATRAMRRVAHALCNFEPTPGQRLEAAVRGFSMVSSTRRGREIEVVMRAPVQTASCRVLVAEPVAARAAPGAEPAVPAVAPPPNDREAGTRLLEPAYIREKNMTVRILGGDY